ncbi:MAG TPA: site-2 protease family protein [Actinomycetota bacterium]|nr:site-2 protease family protein [Actinomycetota bacterium]
MSLGIFIFIFSILFVVMVHEAGHLTVAKLFGFKATKFFIGFGPKIWSRKKGETEYGIAAIPAGGFVKIVGMNPYEDVPPEDVPRAYPNKPAYQRALLLVAGSATHWPVAFLILFVTAMTIGFPTGRATNEVAAVETRLQAGDGEVVAPTTPAAEIGLRPGDKIVAIDGAETPTWTAVRNAIRANPNEEVTFTIDNTGATRDETVRLGTAIFDEQGNLIDYVSPGADAETVPYDSEVVGFLGVQPEPEYQREGFFTAAGTAGYWTADTTVRSFRGIGEVFTMVFGGELWQALQGEGDRQIDEGPLGLVGAGRIAGESVEKGEFLDLIGLIVGFTIFVGVMNLLPLPPLDGGHLAVVAFEKITGRKVDLRKLIPVAAAVISFFVLLFVAVLYLDLARPIRAPF